MLGVIILLLVALFGYWYLRPNRAHVKTSIVTQTWAIANDKNHNSNTDMIQWNSQFYLAYESSPFHSASNKSVMHIKHASNQGHTWMELTTFNANGQYIRDHKFAIIGKRLFQNARKVGLQETPALRVPQS